VAGLAGNPLHPVNRGALCPKAFGGLQLLYADDRLKGPIVRDRERGRVRPVSWDEALALLTGRLADLRTKGLTHTVAILGGQYRGYRDTLWKRFAAAYGTPNYVRVRCLAPERPALAHQLMQGVTAPLGYDLGEARLILSFGVGLLESWLGPVHASLAFARFRGGGDGSRGRLIQVDPRRSPTAIKADQVQHVAQPYLRGFKDLNETDIKSYQALVDVFHKEAVLKERFDVHNVLLKKGDLK
jgi:anaerobic selenocysteine-containing dehydrogenase